MSRTKERIMEKRRGISRLLRWEVWGKGFLLLAAFGTVGTLGGCPKKTQKTTPPPPDMVGGGGGDTRDDPGTEDTSAQQITPETVEKIQSVFRLGKISVERCFQELVNRKKDPKLEGTVIVGVRIGPQPTPVKTWIFKISPKLKEKRFVQCVLDEAAKWNFPTWGGEMDFTSPKYNLLGM